MRHVVSAALTISAGTVGVGKAAPASVLISPPRRTQAVTAGFMSTFRTAKALAPIAMAAKQNL